MNPKKTRRVFDVQILLRALFADTSGRICVKERAALRVQILLQALLQHSCCSLSRDAIIRHERQSHDMIITATYLYGMIQGALPGAWWHFLLTFFADMALAGAVGSKPTTIIDR